MKEAIESIIRLFVDKPDDIKVEEEEQNDTFHYVIHSATEDIGKIIGKEGKVIRAIRNIMKIKAIKDNKRIHISIANNT